MLEATDIYTDLCLADLSSHLTYIW